MARVNIPDADAVAWNDFKNDNSVQVRVTVSPEEAKDYRKGSVVDIDYRDEKAKGRIVSDPLEIRDSADKKKVLSLIVEKMA